MHMLTTVDAVIYARRSQRQDSHASITDQVTKGRAACDQHAWTLTTVIDQDYDHSASRFARKERPGWERLLRLIGDRRADILILWESSRGDRKLSEWAAFLDLCRERRVLIHVISHGRTYEPAVARDWKILAEDGVDNAYESEKLSQRIRRGVESAARRGDPPGGPVPYGYRAVYSAATGRREGWEPDAERAAVVTRVVTDVVAHTPVRAIARKLTGHGIAAPSGREWTEQTIKNLARNPVYAGLRRLGDGELVRGSWPAIIEVASWRDATAILSARQTGRRPGAYQHLLTGLASCVRCQTGLRVMTVSGTRRYTCRRGCLYLPYDWLDQVVTDVVCERLSRPDARDLFERDDTRAAALRAEVAMLRQRHKDFCVAAARGQITPAALATVEDELLPAIAAAQRSLDALTLPPALAGIVSGRDVRAAWDGYPLAARRAIITAITGIGIQHREHYRASGRRDGPADQRYEVRFDWLSQVRLGPGRPRRDWEPRSGRTQGAGQGKLGGAPDLGVRQPAGQRVLDRQDDLP